MKAYVYIFALVVLSYIFYRGNKYRMERKDSPFKYFTWSEFDQPNLDGSGKKYMSEEFIRKLDRIRESVGFPLIINSGYRSPDYNSQVGGTRNSSHIKGLAADISAITYGMKNDIAKAAINEGITRIGWGNSFIHLDIDDNKTQNIVWGYGNEYPTFYELENLA